MPTVRVKRKYNIVLVIVLLLTLAFIFGNSCIGGSRSYELTDSVVAKLTGTQSSSVSSEDGSVDEQKTTSGYVLQADIGIVARLRKSMHFIEFMLLGGELLLLLRLNFGAGVQRTLLALAGGLLAAVCDETIQYFTGRTSRLLDVWIDWSGCLAGTAIVLFVMLAVHFVRKRRLVRKKPE